MKKELTEQQAIELSNEYGWKIEDVKNGYAVFFSNYMSGAVHIEAIGDINDVVSMYSDDKEASLQAELDGIKIIHNLPIKEDDEDFGYFIDTVENRKIIQKHLLSRNIIWNL